MKSKITLLFSLLFLGCALSAIAQSYCPPDIDFELGDYSYWKYFGGQNKTSGGVPTWFLSSMAHTNGLQELQTGAGTDYYGGFPVVGNGLYSLKLSHDTNEYNADAASYNVHVPIGGGTAFSLIYRYAIVMELPIPLSGHTALTRPRWEIDAIDSATGAAIPCDNFTYVASLVLPGFSNSPVTSRISGNGFDVIYKPWTAGSIDLTGWGGHTIIVTFKVGGCTQSGHFGYAYLDMNCGLFKISTVACKATKATLTAPPGDSTYLWTDSATFTINYGTTQTVIVTVPTTTTTYAVILVPFVGYGCKDTLYAQLKPSDLLTHQSDDTTICVGSSVTLSPNATDVALPLTYFWTPATGLSCTTCDSVIATPPAGKYAYQVTTTDAGGCLQTDTINVNVLPIPGVIKGTKSVCLGLTSTLTDSIGLGSWSSSNTTVAVIGSSTGVVTGKVIGTAVITYTFGLSCSSVFTTVTVNPLPTAILGTPLVCQGLTTTLTDATGGGTWSSSGTAISVGSGTGVVTGITGPGTGTVTYTVSSTGCIATQVVTVNPLPGPITGTKTVCAGSNTTLLDGGVGTWSSSNTTVAIVGSGSGIVTGKAPGTSTITFTLTTGCISTAVVTVTPTPVAISGIATMCIGLTSTLSDATLGGIWSSSDTTVAKVGSSSGVVTGVAATTVFVSYTLAGCSAVTTVTVTPLPLSITGTLNVCVGTQTALADISGGGSWSSGNTFVAIVGSSSGFVTGELPGTATITYTLGSGCLTTAVVTVNPNPKAIIGITPLCIGSCVTLSDLTSGGTWNSINGSIASVGVSSGIACGISAGTDTIVYELSTGCLTTATLLVNPNPSIIAGPTSVCIGSAITLTDPGGGTWSSINTTVSVVSGTGVVTGEFAGTATVTYTLPTGCITSTVITINKPPVGISGSTTVCVGANTFLSDATLGGTWSSSNSLIASIIASGGSAGKVTGVATGTATITYTVFTTGCIVTTTVTVSTAPGAISGTKTVCQGLTTVLSDAISGGIWTSSNTVVASVSGGIVTGGITPPSTATITYSIGGSCFVTAVVTVTPAPGPISGTPVMCVGGNVTLTDAGGGTWSSLSTDVSVGSSSGIVTGLSAGNPVITYTTGAGCYVTKIATVNPLPGTITGIKTICLHATTSLSDTTGGGVWSSSNTAVATVGSLTGFVTDLTGGTVTIFYKLTATGCATVATLTINPLPNLYPVTGGGSFCTGGSGVNISLLNSDAGVNYALYDGGVYSGITLPGTGGALSFGSFSAAGVYKVVATSPLTGCSDTMSGSATIAINPPPSPISGPTAVCIGATITLSDAGGGTWASANTAIATVGSGTGNVTGGSTLGCTNITYTLPTGCFTTTTVCVSSSPKVILGPGAVCVGSTITLSDSVCCGGWSDAPIAIGTIDGSGDFTGITSGTAIVTYSLGSGCTITRTISVNPIPKVILGSGTICVGSTLTVSDTTTGGTWSISATSIASIGSSSGFVTGKSAGTATITYTLGCIVTTPLTVSLTPGAISGPSTVCQGSTITLSDIPLGGTWTSSSTVASVSGGGDVLGVAGGVATIVYSLGGSCVASQVVTVNPISAISGPTTLCAGVTVTLSDATSGGTWHSSNLGVATITSGSGLLTGVSTGTSTICYTTSTGCTVCTTVNVSLSPTAILGTFTVCKGSTTTLSDAVPLGGWSDIPVTVGTIDPSSGVFLGINAGTATVTYSLGGTCQVTATVTVDPVDPITGPATVCTGDKITLSNGVPGGHWTTTSGAATVNLTSGVVTAGALPGTATITYTTPSSCISTFLVSINSVPGPISAGQVCVGDTTTITDASAGGIWSSASADITIVGSTGFVTGKIAGIAPVTYSLGAGGCFITGAVTVNPLPSPIIGSSNLCIGSTITLSDAGGGKWSTSSLTVNVNSTSGAVTGLTTPSALITYTLPTGCIATKIITVNPLPGPITGPGTVCVGQTITLVDGGGGTWNSLSPLVASVISGTGVVTGNKAGIASIVYTLSTGCTAATPVTVVPLPTTIVGPPAICIGQTALLTDASTGGTWLSSDPGVASIGSSSGFVTGNASGTVAISYTVGSGCMIIGSIIVNPISPVTGSNVVCQGQTIALMDTTLGGTWSSSNTKAIVNASTGIVTGEVPGAVTITYSMPTGCRETYPITVLAAPKPITGPSNVCVGQSIALHDATAGGTWSSSFPGIGSVDPSGNVTGVTSGITAISYTAAGCPATVNITVNPVPAPIGGTPEVCVGQTTILTDGGGGVWTSGTTTVATISISGVVTGNKAGTSVIDYTFPTGCLSSVVVTVDPLPGIVTGSSNVCVGSTITLSDATSGGAWGSSSTTVSVNAGSGAVTGLSAGTATVSYSLATGCASTILVTVNALPGAILGAASVCVGQTTTLADAGGGAWTSDDTTVAKIGAGTGVVKGISSGTANISYTLGTGCQSGVLFTVNPIPAAITGNTNVCVGTTTNLSDTSAGGAWTSSKSGIATIDPSGLVTGVKVGTTTISYTFGTGCAAATTVVVHPVPTAITGPDNICLGASDVYSNTVSGGVWTSTNTSVATIDPSSGLANGVALGATVISYTITVGCGVSTAVNVVPLPTKYTITGGGPFCAGGSGVGVGLAGSSTGIDYFLYVGGAVATGPVAGTGSALNFGPQTVGGTYTVLAVNTTTGCSVVMLGTVSVIVNPSVKPSVGISVPGGDTVCSGALTNFTAVPVHGGLTPAYQWNINGTNVGLAGIYSYVPANGDVVAVTLTSSETCAVPAIVTDTVKMTVSAPQMPTATIMADPGDTVCQGFPVTLTASLEFGGTLPVITWVKNTVAAATGASFTYLPVNNDVVYCTVTSNYPCLITGTVNSPVIKMTVDSPIIPHVVIVANPGANIKPNQLDTLTADVSNVGSGGATYQWLVNGFPVDTATGAIYINSFKDHDTVSCQVTSSGMCKMTTHNWIYLNVSTEGVQQVLQGVDGITVLPNPNKGEFIVKGSLGTNNDEEVTLELTDLLGQVVYHSKVTARGGNVNEKVTLGKSLANGMYLLNLRSAVDTKVFHVVVEQ